ncbi:MAG: hypothetical protein ACXACB_06250 [Promethearchaeota archaeon]
MPPAFVFAVNGALPVIGACYYVGIVVRDWVFCHGELEYCAGGGFVVTIVTTGVYPLTWKAGLKSIRSNLSWGVADKCS